MQKIIISREVYSSLKPISFEHERVCRLNINGESKILKKLAYNEELRSDTIYTMEVLDRMRNLFSKGFIIPEFEAVCEGETVGFISPDLNADTFGKILNSDLPFEKKIEYFKKLGFLLEKAEEVRKNASFAIGDLHEDNVLIKDDEVFLVDLDSSKVDGNLAKPARYLSTRSLAERVYKYKKDEHGFIIPTRETEIYNYVILILKYIFKINASYITDFGYMNVIDDLRDYRFDKDLINCFYRIVQAGNNINPVNFLDTIKEKSVKKTRFYK